MPYGIAMTDVFASEGGTVWYGYLYLPGEPCDAFPDSLCTFCQTPMGHAGTADPATGADVAQDPATGRHDGILTIWYAPIPGVAPAWMESSHLRCAAMASEAGSITLTLASGIDPEADTPDTREPQHARTA